MLVGKFPNPSKTQKILRLRDSRNLAEIYTHNTDLKKRLLAYAKEYPELCQLTEDDEQGGLRFEIDKHRIGIRLTAPYSEERRAASSQRAKRSGIRSNNSRDNRNV